MRKWTLNFDSNDKKNYSRIMIYPELNHQYWCSSTKYMRTTLSPGYPLCEVVCRGEKQQLQSDEKYPVSKNVLIREWKLKCSTYSMYGPFNTGSCYLRPCLSLMQQQHFKLHCQSTTFIFTLKGNMDGLPKLFNFRSPNHPSIICQTA